MDKPYHIVLGCISHDFLASQKVTLALAKKNSYEQCSKPSVVPLYYLVFDGVRIRYHNKPQYIG